MQGTEYNSLQSQDQAGDASLLSAPDMVSFLIQSLKDEDRNIRERAVRALGETRDARTILPLIDVFRRDVFTKDLDLCIWAEKALVQMGEMTIVPLNETFKENETNKEREHNTLFHTVRLLGMLGEPAFPFLIQALQNENVAVCKRAAQVLGEMGDARAVLPIIEFLHRTRPEKIQGYETELNEMGDFDTIREKIVAEHRLTAVERLNTLEAFYHTKWLSPSKVQKDCQRLLKRRDLDIAVTEGLQAIMLELQKRSDKQTLLRPASSQEASAQEELLRASQPAQSTIPSEQLLRAEARTP